MVGQPKHQFWLRSRVMTGASVIFPIPEHVKIEDHFSDPQGQGLASFYKRGLNERIVEHLCFADIAGTDLAQIIEDVKARAISFRRLNSCCFLASEGDGHSKAAVSVDPMAPFGS